MVDGAARAEQVEEHRESHRDAAIAVAVVALLQIAVGTAGLVRGWALVGVPGWMWFVPVAVEVVLLAALALRIGDVPDEQVGGRRRLVLAVLAVIGVFNALALGAIIASLLGADATSGRRLLLEAATVWATNVVAFGLAFWELDQGGPRTRSQPDPPPADFQFPQLENPSLAEPGWHPRLFDYIYVSFTNATAFSPTDAMPLTRRAKALMLAESALSIVTLLLVAVRAVNILA